MGGWAALRSEGNLRESLLFPRVSWDGTLVVRPGRKCLFPMSCLTAGLELLSKCSLPLVLSEGYLEDALPHQPPSLYVLHSGTGRGQFSVLSECVCPSRAKLMSVCRLAVSPGFIYLVSQHFLSLKKRNKPLCHRPLERI